MQAIGHAQNIQPNYPTTSNQPNTPIPLSQPNTPMQFFTGSMEHAQRTPLSEQNNYHEPPRTYIRCIISVSLRPDEVQLWLDES